MPDTTLLETFPNPAADRDYVIEHVSEEFTSVCPKTGHPDFATVVLRYCPDKSCVELKALKLYYQAFRNEGAFYEKVTNTIADDLQNLMHPRWLIIKTHWRGRGGIHSTLTTTHGPVPQNQL